MCSLVSRLNVMSVRHMPALLKGGLILAVMSPVSYKTIVYTASLLIAIGMLLVFIVAL